ncbi:MAG: hypothetical protein KatS3mg131_1972 [Candidatus Tectimicrobiota bacterium]|nr:MAG: hypothetical protein KatS3mg131_1972 [Candidatus Tectomicrobia bacterium]
MREQARAQRYVQALEQALRELELPQDLALEIQMRLRALKRLLGKLVALMFPPSGWLPQCRDSRVRGWDKNLPVRLLAALPPRSWRKRLRQLALEILVRLGRFLADKSPATRSRWPWRWVGDESLFKKYGRQLGLVGWGWSGQEQRVRLGIDGVLLLVVIGEGKLVVPVDFVVRRPDPQGPGHPCYDKLTWLRQMLDDALGALRRRGLRLPAPLVVADSGFGDAKLMRHVRHGAPGDAAGGGQKRLRLSPARGPPGQGLRSALPR